MKGPWNQFKDELNVMFDEIADVQKQNSDMLKNITVNEDQIQD